MNESVHLKVFPPPKPLLVRIARIEDDPIAIALCPDFENGEWRSKALLDHLFDWLPEVALQPAEREAMLYEANKQLKHSAFRMFKNVDPSKRGELGEILIHAACRQEFSTLPIIARLFFKMRSNDQVTGVDVAHLTYDAKSDDIDLWLGEAKLYEDINSAKYAALKSIKPFWDIDFLSEMKVLVGPKIEPTAPYSERLSWLFEDETSLDKIIDRIVVPICICADFEPTKAATLRDKEYIEHIIDELGKLRDYFSTKIPQEVRFVCIFVPLDSKSKLESLLATKIAAFQ